MKRRISRYALMAAVALLIALGLLYAFWPRPLLVDIGEVRRGELIVTIDEIGRTRVHDSYVVSTPVAGRLLRVEVEPGDPVVQDETVIAQMLPELPATLDIRSREQAQSAVAAAQAALRLERANLNSAMAEHELAQDELARTRTLSERGIASKAALDRAVAAARRAAAAVNTAEAAISMREAELAAARARLISLTDPNVAATLKDREEPDIPLYAPASGRILRVIQQSEATLSAGTPIMEIGDIDSDLEVLVELLSSDAVQVAVGDPVFIVNWGGEGLIRGQVERVDPFGFTKFSALGVEEQRVNTVIRLTDEPEKFASLGHGYRVEARIVVWRNEDCLIVPASALFREGSAWTVFAVEDGKARRKRVDIGRNNGVEAELLAGMEEGERLILYPPASVEDGQAVRQRPR